MIKNLNKNGMNEKISRKANIFLFTALIFLSSCSTYRSSWECPKAKGIGCSSLEYADEMAREQIILNTGENKKINKISKNHGNKKVLLNQDLFGNDEYEVIEVE